MKQISVKKQDGAWVVSLELKYELHVFEKNELEKAIEYATEEANRRKIPVTYPITFTCKTG